MNVFVLSGCIAYEDRDILGVYNSIEDARYQAAEVAREQGGFSYYEVSLHQLGGEAQLMEVVANWGEEDLVDEVA